MRLRRFLAASAAIAMITTGGTAVATAQTDPAPVSNTETTTDGDTTAPAEEEKPVEEEKPAEEEKDTDPTPAEEDDKPAEDDKKEEPKGLQNIGSIDVEFVQKAQAVVGVVGAALSGLVLLFKTFPNLLDPVRNMLKQAGIKL